MKDFQTTMLANPPRLVVLFRRTEGGEEQFQWGVVGKIPLLSLIGFITRVQAELAFRSPDPCPEQALAIMLQDDGKLAYYVHPDIPIDPLVGMLETIKSALTDSRTAQHAAAQQVKIVGPDGLPMRG